MHYSSNIFIALWLHPGQWRHRLATFAAVWAMMCFRAGIRASLTLTVFLVKKNSTISFYELIVLQWSQGAQTHVRLRTPPYHLQVRRDSPTSELCFFSRINISSLPLLFLWLILLIQFQSNSSNFNNFNGVYFA